MLIFALRFDKYITHFPLGINLILIFIMFNYQLRQDHKIVNEKVLKISVCLILQGT